MDDQTIHLSIEYLHKIADHCPRALGTYLLCFQHADDDLCVIIDRDIVTLEHHYSYTRLCNELRMLAREGLLEFYIEDKIIHVTLAAYDA